MVALAELGGQPGGLSRGMLPRDYVAHRGQETKILSHLSTLSMLVVHR
jgi:hypothetical protein